MLIRNSKSQLEYEAKRQQALKLLEIEASNESFLDSKVSSYRDPNKPPEVPPRYRDASEIAQDVLGNQLKLINMFISWGFSSLKANAIVKNIKSNDDILKILQSSNNLKRKLDSYNKELLDVGFVSNIVERFLANYDKTFGGNYENAVELLLSNYFTANKVIPSREQIIKLKSKLLDLKQIINSKQDTPMSIMNDIDSSLESLDKYLELLPFVEDYNRNKEAGVNTEKMKEITALLAQGNIPIASNIESYTRRIEDLIELAKRKELNRADTTQAISQIAKSLEFIITPEAETIIAQIKKRNNLPEDITPEEILIRQEDELLNAKKEKSKLESESELNVLYTDITEQEFIEKAKSKGLLPKDLNTNPQFMRAYYNDKKKATTGTAGAKASIYDRIEESFNSHILKLKEMDIEPSAKLLNDLLIIELREAYKRKDEFPKELPKGGNRKGNGRNIPDPNSVNEEIQARLEIEQQLNPQGYAESKSDVDRVITGQPESKPNFSQEELLKKARDRQDKPITIPEKKTEKNEGLFNTALIEKFKKSKQDDFEIDDNNDWIEGSGLRKNFAPQKHNHMNTSKILKKGLGSHQAYPEDMLELSPDEYSNPYEVVARRSREISKQVRESNSRVREALGMGALGFNHKKIKIGKGIEVESRPKFIQFGKYLLNTPHLYNDSKLTLRFPSGGAIPTIKPISISDDFRDFLINLIETEKMDEKMYKPISKEEKIWFEKVCKGAGLVHKFGIKPNSDNSEANELSRYKLLVGEIEAGNNNKDLVKELRSLILKFMKSGRMSKSDGVYMLSELSVL